MIWGKAKSLVEILCFVVDMSEEWAPTHTQMYTPYFQTHTHTHYCTRPWDTPCDPLLHTPLPSLWMWHTSLILRPDWISAQRESLTPNSLRPPQLIVLQITRFGEHWGMRLSYKKTIDLFRSLQNDLLPSLPSPSTGPASVGMQFLARECSGWGADVLPEDWPS